MAGGFANTDPVSLLNAFTAWDQQRYARQVDVAQRNTQWLDDQAERANNAATSILARREAGVRDYLAQELQGGDASKQVTDMAVDDALQKLDPKRRSELEQKWGDDHIEEIDGLMKELSKNQVFANAWGQDVGAHRRYAGIIPGTIDGQRKYGIIINNDETASRGLLDNSERGKKGGVGAEPVVMNGKEIVDNIVTMSRKAIIGRGGIDDDTAGLGRATLDRAKNAAVEDARGTVAKISKDAGEASANIASERSEMKVITNADGSVAGVAGSGVFTAAGGGAITNNYYAPGAEGATADGLQFGAPGAGGAPATSGRSGVDDPYATDRLDTPMAAVVKGAGKAKGEAQLRSQRAFLDGAADVPTSAAGMVAKINALGKSVLASNAIDRFIKKTTENDADPYTVAKNRGASDDVLASIAARTGKPQPAAAPAAPAATPAPAAAPTAPPKTLPPAARAGAAIADRKEKSIAAASGEKPGKLSITTIRQNFSAKDQEAVLNATGTTILESQKRRVFTPNQYALLTMLQRNGYISDEQIANSQSADTTKLGEVIAGTLAVPAPVSATQVDTSIANERLRNENDLAKAWATARAKGDGSEPKMDNFTQSLKEFTDQRLPDEGKLSRAGERAEFTQFSTNTMTELMRVDPYFLAKNGLSFAALQQMVFDEYKRIKSSGKGQGWFGSDKDVGDISNRSASAAIRARTNAWHGDPATLRAYHSEFQAGLQKGTLPPDVMNRARAAVKQYGANTPQYNAAMRQLFQEWGGLKARGEVENMYPTAQ